MLPVSSTRHQQPVSSTHCARRETASLKTFLGTGEHVFHIVFVQERKNLKSISLSDLLVDIAACDCLLIGGSRSAQLEEARVASPPSGACSPATACFRCARPHRSIPPSPEDQITWIDIPVHDLRAASLHSARTAVALALEEASTGKPMPNGRFG